LRVALVLLGILIVLDYADHLTRDDPRFREMPLAWAAFTFLSAVTLVAVLLGGRALVGRLLGRTPAIGDMALAGVALALHVTLTGPLWARLAGVGASMTFSSPLLPAAAGFAAMLAVWAATRPFDRRQASESGGP
jgi:hypothetical protein